MPGSQGTHGYQQGAQDAPGYQQSAQPAPGYQPAAQNAPGYHPGPQGAPGYLPPAQSAGYQPGSQFMMPGYEGYSGPSAFNAPQQHQPPVSTSSQPQQPAQPPYFDPAGLQPNSGPRQNMPPGYYSYDPSYSASGQEYQQPVSQAQPQPPHGEQQTYKPGASAFSITHQPTAGAPPAGALPPTGAPANAPPAGAPPPAGGSAGAPPPSPSSSQTQTSDHAVPASSMHGQPPQFFNPAALSTRPAIRPGPYGRGRYPRK